MAQRKLSRSAASDLQRVPRRRAALAGETAAAMAAPPAVFLVDADSRTRHGMQEVLAAEAYAVRTFADGQSFLRVLNEQTRGCVFVDLDLPAPGGLALVEELQRRAVPIPVVCVSTHGEVDLVVQAIKGGAMDFMIKPVGVATLLSHAREALEREATLWERACQRRDYRTRLSRLTSRERQVLTHLLHGESSKHIAAALDISYKTVDVHRTRIFSKTGYRNQAELIRASLSLDGARRSA